MKYFLDTEFSENGYQRIDLISIGVAAEDGRTYYAVAADGWAPEHCNEWVRANVLPHLLPANPHDPYIWPRAIIATDLAAFCSLDGPPEVWGYYADYDWVLFCQLFGRMVDLPKGWPMYCRDLKQLAGDRRLPKQESQEHNALADAVWIRDQYRRLTEGAR